MDPTRRMLFSIDELNSSDDENPSRGRTESEVGSNVGASTSNADSPTKKYARSNVWDHFTRNIERGPDGKVIRVIAKYKICSSILNVMTKNSTSHLTRHFNAHTQQNKNMNIRK